MYIPRCYFDKDTSRVSSVELHGFSDVSELAYAATVDLHLTDTDSDDQTSLVTVGTKVAPIKHPSTQAMWSLSFGTTPPPCQTNA